jgi:hypothetical protein
VEAAEEQKDDDRVKAAGLQPRPVIVLDTRDGVFEAVANEFGIGFMWEHGSSRTDKIVKIDVPEVATQLPEHIFCLVGKRDKLVELFFQSPKIVKRTIL